MPAGAREAMSRQGKTPALNGRPTLVVALVILWTSGAFGQVFSESITAAYHFAGNIPYAAVNNTDARLDVYSRSDTVVPQPTLIWFHGGGWTSGKKDDAIFSLLPYMEMGWNVVNVEYRPARVSPAPGAVEDGRCALRWVIRNAKEYSFDTSKIVVSGSSAGGHLALMTALIPPSAGLDRQCPGNEELKVAAVIDWYGITDVADLLDGAHTKGYAVQWVGNLRNRLEIATRVSPLTYIRSGVPPILSIHANADPAVPYSQSVRLQQALKKVGVDGDLITLSGPRHGGFTRSENHRIFRTIKLFLAKHGLVAQLPAAD
jgi:acetyl esterase/lipase